MLKRTSGREVSAQKKYSHLLKGETSRSIFAHEQEIIVINDILLQSMKATRLNFELKSATPFVCNWYATAGDSGTSSFFPNGEERAHAEQFQSQRPNHREHYLPLVIAVPWLPVATFNYFIIDRIEVDGFLYQKKKDDEGYKTVSVASYSFYDYY